MSTLQATSKTRNNEELHRQGLKQTFAAWLKSMAPERQQVARAGLRHALTRRQAKVLEFVNVPKGRDQKDWQDGNREATIDEAQRRADESGGEFIVFEVGQSLYGIIPSDSYQESFGTKVKTVQPRGK